MERVRHPEITPIELPDVRGNGATLWQGSRHRQFCVSLRQALEGLPVGRIALPTGDPAQGILAGIEAVFLTGGRVEDTALRDELSRLFRPVLFGEEPVFGGEPGGMELLHTRGLSGWVLDLGKSRLKLSAPCWRWTFPRDWMRLRPADEVSFAETPAQRRRLREFIAMNLQIAMAECGERPPALVVALPTRLAADGTPDASNYAGMCGDRALLPEALEMAGLGGRPLFVLNDAELAALSLSSAVVIVFLVFQTGRREIS